MNPLETMMRPCPEDICDGTGMVFNDETGREEACLCMIDHAAEPMERMTQGPVGMDDLK